MAYNTSNITSSTDFAQLAIAVNQQTGHLFFVVLLFFVWITFMAILRGQQNTTVSIMIAGFVTFSIASIFWTVQIISGEMLLMLGVLLGISIFVSIAFNH